MRIFHQVTELVHALYRISTSFLVPQGGETCDYGSEGLPKRGKCGPTAAQERWSGAFCQPASTGERLQSSPPVPVLQGSSVRRPARSACKYIPRDRGLESRYKLFDSNY